MAFTSCHGSHGVSHDGKREMTIQEFKLWLKTFDIKGDDRISQRELREAVRRNGGWFSGWKSKYGIKSADKNRDGFVDQAELNMLSDFAQKHLGVKIVA